MKKITFLWISTIICCIPLTKVQAQKADFSKMSRMLKTIVVNSLQQNASEANTYEKQIQHLRKSNYANSSTNGKSICAFVKTTESENGILQKLGCRKLASFGNIHIADIPISSIPLLSLQKNVLRIEASESHTLTLDTAIVIVKGEQLHSGANLPQAYTGRGVIMGVMDVGFDLTNPNFYDTSLSHTRIQRFWDQLSPDSVRSTLYVGADYRTEEEILGYAHSHDGLQDTHGTHTLGIAAGTGFDTPYRGMAFDADICLVSNAVNTDLPLIPNEQLYKYTSATDALGFKYIFDYAEETGKPCVISFSESSTQSMDNDEELFQEVIEQMTGPGRILVASAGNQGESKTYLHKAKGNECDGMFIYKENNSASFSLTSDGPFTSCIKAYATDGITQKTEITSRQIVQSKDSILEDSIVFFGKKVKYNIYAYKPYFDPNLTAFDFVIRTDGGIGTDIPLSFEIVGRETDIKIYSNNMTFYADNRNSALSGGERKASIGSPACSPSVICVGATAWRNHSTNFEGTPLYYDCGMGGVVASYSSTGPTRDALVKPDVMAPGTFVISSASSFYAEENIETAKKDIASFSEFNGRKYPWASFVGTSMSTPVVAGIIAQWLEANPKLTKDDIMEVFSHTCHKKNQSETDKTQSSVQEKDNQWGYGEIDAYAGLLNILQFDRIKDISNYCPTALNITFSNRLLNIALAHNYQSAQGEKFDNGRVNATISIFSQSGKKTIEKSITLTHDKQDIPLSQLAEGIYIVQIRAEYKACCGSVILRVN